MADTKKMKGLLRASGLTVVQKKKNAIGENGDYYYNLTLTNGEDILVITAGKVADELQLMKSYNFGFDFLDKRLKLVSVEVA